MLCLLFACSSGNVVWNGFGANYGLWSFLVKERVWNFQVLVWIFWEIENVVTHNNSGDLPRSWCQVGLFHTIVCAEVIYLHFLYWDSWYHYFLIGIKFHLIYFTIIMQSLCDVQVKSCIVKFLGANGLVWSDKDSSIILIFFFFFK